MFLCCRRCLLCACAVLGPPLPVSTSWSAAAKREAAARGPLRLPACNEETLHAPTQDSVHLAHFVTGVRTPQPGGPRYRAPAPLSLPAVLQRPSPEPAPAPRATRQPAARHVAQSCPPGWRPGPLPAQSTTTRPRLRAVPSTIRTAPSMLTALVSAYFFLAISYTGHGARRMPIGRVPPTPTTQPAFRGAQARGPGQRGDTAAARSSVGPAPRQPPWSLVRPSPWLACPTPSRCLRTHCVSRDRQGAGLGGEGGGRRGTALAHHFLEHRPGVPCPAHLLPSSAAPPWARF